MTRQPHTYLNHAGIVSSIGCGIEKTRSRLFSQQEENFLTITDSYSPGNHLSLGLVNSPLSPVKVESEGSRNNRMLTTAIEQLLPHIELLKEKFHSNRIGIVIGTSTSGISDGEKALLWHKEHGNFPSDYHYYKQEVTAPSRYLAKWLNISGPTFTVSTACTSGAKALASAARLIKLGVCDAVIAGGVDTLCKMTVEGFSALEVTTKNQCLPFSINRCGINIGEGAGVFIVSNEPAEIRLAAVGESSDAYHISAPHPEGKGAELAIHQALKQANITPDQVDYLNLHGTATQQNDSMEALSTFRVFGAEIACSSTKPLTGHTLAAAGSIEAIFCWLTLQRNDCLLPPHIWDGQYDPELPKLSSLSQKRLDKRPKTVMSNSFAFGGNNTSLILATE